jgi:transcriptional regulator with XRE-family HTH domain
VRARHREPVLVGHSRAFPNQPAVRGLPRKGAETDRLRRHLSEDSKAVHRMKPLHRIREVRRREGVSIRTIVRKTGIDMGTVKALDNPVSDPTLSQLARFADAIEVPLCELICDADADEVQRLRGLLVRVSKITNLMLAKLPNGPARRLVQSIDEHIREELPDAEVINALHGVTDRDVASHRDEFPVCTNHLASDQNVAAIFREAG